jgi:cytochrome c5
MKAHWIAGLVAAALAIAASAQELSDEARAEIAERISYVGSVCLEGEDCGGSASKAGSASAAASSGSGASGSGGAAAAASGGAAAAAQVADASATAAGSSASGEAVYNKACVACHAAGVAGAPVVGDAAAWSDRIAKGMDALYNSGINGVAGGAMMAKGGCVSCSDDEIRAAVDYMVAQSQ